MAPPFLRPAAAARGPETCLRRRRGPQSRGMRILSLLVLLAAVSPVVAHAQREKLPPADLAIVKERWPEAERNSTGLRSVVLRTGEGPLAARGDEVSVLFRGELLDGTVFDEATDPAKPFTFRLGRGVVIDGWDYGIALMREGEKRLLIIPHELGYGSRGRSPTIPRKATLIFEVELLKVTPSDARGN